MKLPKFLPKLKRLRAPLVVRRTAGNSMLPHLKHGKIVVGRAWFQKLSNRDVIIFRHGGKEKIKRIRCFSGGWLEVHGDNPQSSTDSRHFGMIPPGTVLAKVIWPRNKRSN